MRNRSSVVLKENIKVLLIQRIRDDLIYYVFPGGGIEMGEILKLQLKREAFEELGEEINVNECMLEVAFNGTQYFFRSEIIAGIVGTGEGEEYIDETRDRGMYLPMWVNID